VDIELSKQPSAKAAVLKKLADREVSTSELVDGMKKEGVKKDDAARALMSLKDEGKLSIREASPYAGIGSFAWSPYSLWFWGALGAVALSVVLTTVSSGVFLYARYVFGSLLILFLPGYALIEALYPKKHHGPQIERVVLIKTDMDDDLTRFALSIGLSLAIVPLTGLALNYTPFGIRLAPVVISLAGITVALLCYALYRRYQYYRLAKGIL
jgi:Protein of unknown function (DUF1616)